MTERAHRIRLTFFVVVPLVATLFAVYLLWRRYVFPGDLVLFSVFYVLTALGVTIGYHRMLTHDGFKTHPWIKGFFLVLGVMSFNGLPDEWAATHIKHHAHSDHEGDPHSPLDGFWHAHLGWLYHLSNFPDVKEYAPHLLKDPVVQFVRRYCMVWMALSLFLPWLLGGWTGLLWGGLVRIFLTNHVIWSVNSICHSFGSRTFEVMDESRNEWVVGLLGLGEGWHNNHHAFPRNAFHGLYWWQFDLSGLILRFLEKLGMVWDVQRVSQELITAKLRKAETMRAALAAMRAELSAKVASAKRELGETLRQPFREPLSEEHLAEFSIACRDAMERLETIQRNLAQSRDLRKQKLLAYREEIADLVARAKRRAPKLVAA